MFNGFKTSGVSTNRLTGLDRNLSWSIRSYTDLGSDYDNDGEPDLSWHARPLDNACWIQNAAAGSRLLMGMCRDFGL